MAPGPKSCVSVTARRTLLSILYGVLTPSFSPLSLALSHRLHPLSKFECNWSYDVISRLITVDLLHIARRRAARPVREAQRRLRGIRFTAELYMVEWRAAVHVNGRPAFGEHLHCHGDVPAVDFGILRAVTKP